MQIVLSVFLLIIFSSPFLLADETIVAKVNETVFTMDDLESEVDRLIPKITFHKNVVGEKRKRYYDQAVQELINRELLYQYAISKSMKPEPAKFKAHIDQIRTRVKPKEEFSSYLADLGINEEQLYKEVEKNILIQDVLNENVIKPSKMKIEEVKDYYDKNIDKFREPESIRLRIIAIKDEKKAQEAYTKIKAGEKFEDIASTMSEDKYRIKGGDIGYFHKKRLLPEMEKIIDSLNHGDISEPQKIQDMWFIIKVEDKKPEKQIPFDSLKDKLKKEMEIKRAEELKEKFLSELRAKAKIEILFKKAIALQP